MLERKHAFRFRNYKISVWTWICRLYTIVCRKISKHKKLYLKFDKETSFDSAEGVTEGLVKLTKNEASIVKFAMDVDNWIDHESDAYGAGGSIDIEHPVECEER